MKLCPNCRKQIPDSAKFCTYCGTKITAAEPAGKPVRKRNKGLRIALSLTAAAAAFGVCTWFLFSSPVQGKTYDELISMGEKYLYEADYERAEECFLKAKKLEPKKQEAYEYLDSVYQETDQDQKAALLYEEAEDNGISELQIPAVVYADLTEEELEEANQAADKKDSGKTDQPNRSEKKEPADGSKDDNRSNNKAEADQGSRTSKDGQAHDRAADQKKKEVPYTTLAELGTLDMPPVEIGNAGWLIMQNGKYGLIDSAGKTLQKPGQTSWSRASLALEDEEAVPAACISDSLSAGAAVSLPTGVSCSGISPARGTPVYYLKEDKSIASCLPLTGETSEVKKEDLKKEFSSPHILLQKSWEPGKSLQDYFKGESYYIYNPSKDETYGPYEASEKAGFGLYSLEKAEFNTLYSLLGSEEVLSPFYVKSDDGYSIFSKDGSEKKEGFDAAFAVSENAIGTVKGDTFTLYDSDLNEIYSLEVEAGGVNIGKNVPIQTDGTWKIVEYAELPEQKENKPAAEEKKLLEKLAGTYTLDADGYKILAKVEADGSFRLAYHRDAGETEGLKSYEKAIVSGKLKAGSKTGDQKHETLVVEEIHNVSSVGETEEIENAKITYIELPLNLTAGQTFTVYEPGTDLEKLEESEKNLLKSYSNEKDKKNLLVYTLISSDLKIPLLKAN